MFCHIPYFILQSWERRMTETLQCGRQHMIMISVKLMKLKGISFCPVVNRIYFVAACCPLQAGADLKVI